MDDATSKIRDVLIGQYPTPELLIRFLRQEFPADATMFESTESENPDSVLYSSAARFLSGLGFSARSPLLAATQSLDSTNPGESDVVKISTNTEFFRECALELARSNEVRLTVVGPTFLEPDWLSAREPIQSEENFSVVLRAAVESKRLKTCEIILRNDPERYTKNLREYVASEEEWGKVIDEMLDSLSRVFGERGECGPRIRCLNPGFAHLPHIFAGCVLVASRRTQGERVNGGWRLTGQSIAELERGKWANIFEQADQDQAQAVDQLRAFVESLRPLFGRA